VTPTTPTTPVTPTTPETPTTPQYFDVNHNPVSPDFPGEVYDAQGGMVKGASRGYDKYGNVLGAGRIPKTGDSSQMVLFGTLTVAAAVGLICWAEEERKKRQK
jgi:hypothetical protein